MCLISLLPAFGGLTDKIVLKFVLWISAREYVNIRLVEGLSLYSLLEFKVVISNYFLWSNYAKYMKISSYLASASSLSGYCEYANMWSQFCLKFALVVLLIIHQLSTWIWFRSQLMLFSMCANLSFDFILTFVSFTFGFVGTWFFFHFGQVCIVVFFGFWR